MGRIAIIDDAVDSADLFAYILEGEHQIRTFTIPEDFLREFRAGSFELILMDIIMPGIDGFELFQQIQHVDSSVPVVAVSALANPKEREKALAAGFCDYFVKPIHDVDVFRDAVHSHIGRCANSNHKKAG
jgi:DNA-binding response OmpR family regulator